MNDYGQNSHKLPSAKNFKKYYFFASNNFVNLLCGNLHLKKWFLKNSKNSKISQTIFGSKGSNSSKYKILLYILIKMPATFFLVI